MNRLRALVFDFDGTIAETERSGHRIAYNAAFEDLGLPDRWDEEEYGRMLVVAGGRERLEAYFARVRPELDASDRELLARRVHEAKRKRFDAIGPRLAPRAGIARILAEARACGVRTAIATTASPDGVAAFLSARPGFAFDAIAAGDEVPKKKPAPDIYVVALERLGVGARDALALEDSAIGLRAARAAGIATLVTPSGYTRDDDFRGAAAVLSDLGEPGAPVRTLAGTAPPRGYVDIDYAASLLA